MKFFILPLLLTLLSSCSFIEPLVSLRKRYPNKEAAFKACEEWIKKGGEFTATFGSFTRVENIRICSLEKEDFRYVGSSVSQPKGVKKGSILNNEDTNRLLWSSAKIFRYTNIINYIDKSNEANKKEVEERERVINLSPPILSNSSKATIALAEHMKKQNIILYSAFWSKKSQKQKEILGKQAIKKFLVIECAPDGKRGEINGKYCKNFIRSFPTWWINGDTRVGTFGLEALANLSGYEGPKDKNFGKSPKEVLSKSSQFSLNLADHLTKNNFTLYTTFWSSHCQEQKELFGKEASKKLNIIECDINGKNNQYSLCNQKNLIGFPTWEFNGNRESGTKSLKDLADLSEYKSKEPF